MTAWMRARVASCTRGDWLITRETVFLETLASRAMSLMVALRPGLMPAGLGAATALAGAGGFGTARAAVAFFRERFMGSLYGSLAPECRVVPNNQGGTEGDIGTARQRRLPNP